jgi:putative ABC transport system substrate-binding protein
VISTPPSSLVELHADALLVGAAALFNSHRDRLVALASRHTVPAIYPWREATVAGGLISYGTSFTAVNRQIGITSEESSKAPIPPTCRSSSRPPSNWLLTSRPRRS